MASTAALGCRTEGPPLGDSGRVFTGRNSLRRIILGKMPSVDNRPNPEELLRRVQADERKESRGRLKVFLGYASRVGKSLRMFDEGRRRKKRGEDVVVGALQSGTAPEIQEILSHLEVVPTITASYGGRDY